MMIVARIGLLSLISVYLTATAADMTVAGGLTLGAPLPAIQHCEVQNHIVVRVPDWCLSDHADSLAPGWEIRTIVLGTESRIPIIQGNIEAFVRDGNLVAVRFETGGFDTQASDLKTLMKKYGNPTSFKVQRFQNAFGAKFDGAKAVWNLRGLRVQFDGVLLMDVGRVIIAVPKGAELLSKERRRTADSAPKL